MPIPRHDLRRRLSRAGASVLLPFLLLAGCAAPPVVTTPQLPAGWSQQQAALAQIQQWQARGKLGVRQGDRSDSAVINQWQQRGRHFDLNLSSAVFGLGATRIHGTPEAIWFARSGEQPLFSDNPEALIREQVGWTLPINHLLYWVKGIPAPAQVERQAFDPEGRLHLLEQSGWSIRYAAYHPTEPYPLPRRLVLERDDIRLTLVINDWQLESP